MFKKQIEIPSAEQILAESPVPASLAQLKRERDRLLIDVITGRSDKLIVIVGPCPAP